MARDRSGARPAELIRTAGPDDLEALAALKRTVEDATYSHYGTAAEHEQSLQDYCSPAFVRSLMALADVLVAVDDDQVVGMVAVRRRDEVVSISALYCAVPSRGYGTALLVAALEGSDEHETVRCEVFEQNVAARHFFETRGFQANGAWRPSESYAGHRLLQLESTVGRTTAAATAR